MRAYEYHGYHTHHARRGGRPRGTGTEATVQPPAIDDGAFLARSEHRVTVLAALADRPRSRSDLREMTGVSSSTIGRTIREFEERRWIARDGHRYGATPLGSFVASAVTGVLERIETERKLRDVWDWLPIEASRLSVETLSGAVVTVATADDPYRPVNRFVSLLRRTNRFRFVGSDLALLEPRKDELRQRIVDGMETEIIDPPNVARYVLSAHPEHCSDPLESGNLTVRLHDDLPDYGLGLFDDRIGISGYDPDSGTVRVLIETDEPEVCEWAESTYESYRCEARPLLPDTFA
jgi:predicted transcriptional regulator